MTSSSTTHYFLPRIWEEISDNTEFYSWHFLKPLIGKGVFWASIDWYNQHKNLPPGYEYYLIKVEGPNVEWILSQAEKVDGHLFVMCLPSDYNFFKNYKNITFLPCVEWHYQLDCMQSTYGTNVTKNIEKKFSILTHRATHSKIVALSAVLHQSDKSDVCYSLHEWMENKNVHDWQDSSNTVVNFYKNSFIKNYTNWKNTIDEDFFSNYGFQQYNYHHVAYQNCALNITNESWNYSFKHNTILPGPFITEKTLKCLLGETAFLPNGQHNIYHTLKQFGFQFDYNMDLGFDNEVGDLSRLEGLINCIKSTAMLDTQQLFEQTRQSCLHNKEWILSKSFYQQAENFNLNSLNKLLSIIK